MLALPSIDLVFYVKVTISLPFNFWFAASPLHFLSFSTPPISIAAAFPRIFFISIAAIQPVASPSAFVPTLVLVTHLRSVFFRFPSSAVLPVSYSQIKIVFSASLLHAYASIFQA
jgi:hypothetical protein